MGTRESCNNGFSLGTAWGILGIFGTIFLMIFAFIPEVVAHSDPGNDEGVLGASDVEIETADTPNGAPPSYHAANGELSGAMSTPRPTLVPAPRLRARRLVIATYTFVPFVLIFSMRMATVSSTCAGVNFDWTWVALLNIVPFCIAGTAWLRTLIDCLLVRLGGGLTIWMWPPVIPLGWLVLGFRQFARWWVDGTKEKKEEMAMELQQVREGERTLVGSVDGTNRNSDESSLFAVSMDEADDEESGRKGRKPALS